MNIRCLTQTLHRIVIFHNLYSDFDECNGDICNGVTDSILQIINTLQNLDITLCNSSACLTPRVQYFFAWFLHIFGPLQCFFWPANGDNQRFETCADAPFVKCFKKMHLLWIATLSCNCRQTRFLQLNNGMAETQLRQNCWNLIRQFYAYFAFPSV